ncbi:MAG TPA: hypothetical protein DEB39_00985 [Planctomycetaceae bacterium]|nr:hypothetical protein [Planctomycetaceae bacterium]
MRSWCDPSDRFQLKRDELAIDGLIPEDVNAMTETAMQGTETTQILEGKRNVNVLLRVSDAHHENLEAPARMPIQTPNGQLYCKRPETVPANNRLPLE